MQSVPVGALTSTYSFSSSSSSSSSSSVPFSSSSSPFFSPLSPAFAPAPPPPPPPSRAPSPPASSSPVRSSSSDAPIGSAVVGLLTVNLGQRGWCEEAVRPALVLAETHPGSVVAVAFTETHFAVGAAKPRMCLSRALAGRWVFVRQTWGLARRKRDTKGGVLLALRRRARGFVYRGHTVMRPESARLADTQQVRVEYFCGGGVVSLELFSVYLACKDAHRELSCVKIPEQCSAAHPSAALPLLVEELASVAPGDPGWPARVAMGDFNARGGTRSPDEIVSLRLRVLDELADRHKVNIVNEPYFTRFRGNQRPSMLDLFLVPSSQLFDVINCRPIWSADGGNPLGGDHFPTVLWIRVRAMRAPPSGCSLSPFGGLRSSAPVVFDPSPLFEVLSQGDARAVEASRTFLAEHSRSASSSMSSSQSGDLIEACMVHALAVVGAASHRYAPDGSRVCGWNAVRREVDERRRAGASEAELSQLLERLHELRVLSRRRSRKRRRDAAQAPLRAVLSHPNPSVGSAIIFRELRRPPRPRGQVDAQSSSEKLQMFHGSMIEQRRVREELAGGFGRAVVNDRRARANGLIASEWAAAASGREAFEGRAGGEHLARLRYANRQFSVTDVVDAVAGVRLSSATRTVPTRALHLFFPRSAVGRGRLLLAPDADLDESAQLEMSMLAVVADHANVVLASQELGRCHTAVRLAPIPKPGKEGLPLHESHRFIGVSSLLAAVVGRLLKSRLSGFLEAMSGDPAAVRLGYGFRDSDCGFRPRRGAVEAVFEVCCFADSAERGGVPMQLSFYDVRGAFPSVPWSSLVLSLFDRGLCGGPLFRTLVGWVQQSSTHFRAGPRRSGDLPMQRGVVEGGAFSPTMFSSVFSPLCLEVSDAVERSLGRVPGIDESGALLYADDHVRMDASGDGLDLQVRAGSEATVAFFAEHQLSAGIGPKKTAVLRNVAAVSDAGMLSDLESASCFGGSSVPSVDEYTYLGVLIRAGGARCVSDANWARVSERWKGYAKQLRWESAVGVSRAAIGRVCWLAHYVTKMYFSVGAWSCTPAPDVVVWSHAAAARMILRCPLAPRLMSMLVLGLRPHFAIVARARVDLVVLAMSRDPESRLRSRLVALWRELREGNGGPWALSLYREAVRAVAGLRFGRQDLIGLLDRCLLGRVEISAGHAVNPRSLSSFPALPAGVVPAEKWSVRGAQHSRLLASVDACVLREMCHELVVSESGAYDDHLRLLWRRAADDELRSDLCVDGRVPRWPGADPSVPFPMVDSLRDDAFFSRSRAAMGWKYMVGAARWAGVRAAGLCLLCRAGSAVGSVSLSFDHLFLECPRLRDDRAAALAGVVAALEDGLDCDEAAGAVASAEAVLGGPGLVAGAPADARCMWVCLVLGWPASVPFMPRYCDPPHSGEMDADAGRSRRLRLSVLSALAPLACGLRGLWDPPADRR